MIAGTDTILIQRVIPHYRTPLFRELYDRLGVRVVTAGTPPGGSFLNLADPRELEFAIPEPFNFPDRANAFSAHVPTRLILDQLRPKRVIAEFGMRMSSTYELALARYTGRLSKLAFWSHGWQMGRGFDSLSSRAIQYGRLPLFAAADALATYTEEGAAWVRQHLPRKPIVALGNALDVSAMRQAAAASAPVRHGAPQLLAVGRMTDDKRFDLLIEMFGEIRQVYPGAALTIIGDGPEHGRLTALAGDRLGGSIQMPGMLYGEPDLAPHFLGADFFMVTGAAGLSVNHALAYNLPVVAFARTPGGPLHHPEIEYVVDSRTGVLVTTPTLRAMADATIANYADGTHLRLKNNLLAGTDTPTIESVVSNFEVLLAAMPV